MSNRNIVTIKRPPSWNGALWREALPVGNGLTGALLFGAISDEAILLNRHDVWEGATRNMPLPDISDSLAEMRRVIDAGDYQAANSIMYDALKASGYKASTATPAPLCRVNIHMPVDKIFAHYRRGIDMERGEVFVAFNLERYKFCRRMFISRDDGFAYFKASADRKFENVISARRPEGYDCECDVLVKDGRGYISVCGLNEGKPCGALICVIPDGGTLDVLETNAAKKLRITARSYLLISRTFCGSMPDFSVFDQFSDSPDVIYADRLEHHSAIHGELFRQRDIVLASDQAMAATNDELLESAYESEASDALIERLWRFGRYLFISGTNDGGNPFALYGLWHGEPKLGWAQNVANENVQLIYQQSISGGLVYAMRALINYYYKLMPDFEDAAQKLFGCRGIYVTAYTSPGQGYPAVNVPVILNWIGAAGWLCSMFYDYYAATHDEETFSAEILPFMHKAARFYSDYVIIENGRIRVYPSVSPENSPANFIPDGFNEHMGHICPAVQNATMDIAIIKELLTNISAIARQRGLYSDELPRWDAILSAIQPYMTNPDGDIKEWQCDDLLDFYQHRHLSHVYALFPGHEADSNPALRRACEKAVDKRELGGLSGWSFGHMACIYARLGRADMVRECVTKLAKACILPNLFTLHNDWRHMGASLDLGEMAPVQLDALMGITAAIQTVYGK